MLVDSHCHLNYLEDPDDSILRATRFGITSMLCVCVNEETAKDVIELSKRYENVYASLGSHPESAGEDLSWLQESGNCTQAIAIGEMGLDYKSKSLEDLRHTQLQSFEYQMALAGDLSNLSLFILEKLRTIRSQCLRISLDLGVCCTASLNLRG